MLDFFYIINNLGQDHIFNFEDFFQKSTHSPECSMYEVK